MEEIKRYLRIIRDTGLVNEKEAMYPNMLGLIFPVYEEFDHGYVVETADKFMLVLREDALVMAEKEVFHSGSPKKESKKDYYEVWPGVQALDVIASLLEKEEFIGFLKGNILKYQLRKGNKPGEPLEKDQEKLNTYKQILNDIL